MSYVYMIVDDVKEAIQTLNELFRNYKEAQQGAIFAVSAAAVRGFISLMSSHVDTIISVAFQIKTTLKIIDEENAYSKRQTGCGEGTADERIRTSITQNLKQKLKESRSELQAIQEYIHQENRELIRRGAYAVTGNWPSEEEVIDLMEAEENKYITRIEIEHGAAGQVRQIFGEIQERYEAVAELSKQTVKLAQVYMEMAAFDNLHQDQMLDDIERQVTRAVEYSP